MSNGLCLLLFLRNCCIQLKHIYEYLFVFPYRMWGEKVKKLPFL